MDTMFLLTLKFALASALGNKCDQIETFDTMGTFFFKWLDMVGSHHMTDRSGRVALV